MAQGAPRLFVSVYTDDDVTNDLAPALKRRGYGAQSAAEAGNLGVPDEARLSYAADQGMATLTYNVQDFIALARRWHSAGREHAGIILSGQFSHRRFVVLLRRVLRLLDSLTAGEIRNQIVFLQRFKP